MPYLFSSITRLSFWRENFYMSAEVLYEDFWTAYEKWAIVHHFMGKGYIPTHKGWEEDVYHLKKGMSEPVTASSSQGSLKLPVSVHIYFMYR